jgi:hypothetical protein
MLDLCFIFILIIFLVLILRENDIFYYEKLYILKLKNIYLFFIIF